MRRSFAKKIQKGLTLMTATAILSSSLAFAAPDNGVELGNKVFTVNNKVLVEEVMSPADYYIANGVKYKYNYNTLAKNSYTHNQAAAKEAFNYINEIRKSKGLPALVWDDEMLRSTTVRAMEIGEKWAHQRPDGSSFATSSKIIRSECLGKTTSVNPKSIVHAWLNSKAGHREAMLTTKYTKVYISCVTTADGKYNLYAMHQR